MASGSEYRRAAMHWGYVTADGIRRHLAREVGCLSEEKIYEVATIAAHLGLHVQATRKRGPSRAALAKETAKQVEERQRREAIDRALLEAERQVLEEARRRGARRAWPIATLSRD